MDTRGRLFVRTREVLSTIRDRDPSVQSLAEAALHPVSRPFNFTALLIGFTSAEAVAERAP